MPNFNDAEITDIFVSQLQSPGVQDDAPNAPNGGQFDVTVEMVAGTGVKSESYTLLITCADVTAVASAPAAMVPAIPGSGSLGTSTGWAPAGTGSQWYQYNQTATAGPGTSGHVYQYTASLVNNNFEVVSIRQSDLFTVI